MPDEGEFTETPQILSRSHVPYPQQQHPAALQQLDETPYHQKGYLPVHETPYSPSSYPVIHLDNLKYLPFMNTHESSSKK